MMSRMPLPGGAGTMNRMVWPGQRCAPAVGGRRGRGLACIRRGRVRLSNGIVSRARLCRREKQGSTPMIFNKPQLQAFLLTIVAGLADAVGYVAMGGVF